MYEIYDAHCHLEAAKDSSVKHLAIASIELKDINQLHEFRQNNPLVKIGTGLHPWYVENTTLPELEKTLVTNIQQYAPNFIGECGLDKLKPNFELQQKICLLHCQIAAAYNLPIVFHCVRAYNELLHIITQVKSITGMVHGFNGNKEIAKEFARKNIKIGIGSLILKTDSQISKSVKKISLDNILIETDSPYMAIVDDIPSKPEDGYLYCQKLSALRNENFDDCLIKVNHNWETLFNSTTLPSSMQF